MIEHDRKGVIYEMGKIMADNGFNIQTLIVTRNLGPIMIEMHVDKTDGVAVKKALEDAGYSVRLVVSQKVK
ncbi:MAG TPA: hypothetical protein DDW71_10655, partial [Lactobacillus sp.]|nr:hypothetical protein [Lactobacillus sp.]